MRIYLKNFSNERPEYRTFILSTAASLKSFFGAVNSGEFIYDGEMNGAQKYRSRTEEIEHRKNKERVMNDLGMDIVDVIQIQRGSLGLPKIREALSLGIC